MLLESTTPVYLAIYSCCSQRFLCHRSYACTCLDHELKLCGWDSMCAHVQLSHVYLTSALDVTHVINVPGSPRPYSRKNLGTRLPGNASRHAGDTTSIVFLIVQLQRNHVIVGFAILPYRTMLDGLEETESSPPLGYDTATIPMSPHESSPPLGYDTGTIPMSPHESSPPLGYDTGTIPMSPHESSPPLGYDNPQLPATCSVPYAVSQTTTLQWPYPYPYGPVYGQMPSLVVP